MLPQPLVIGNLPGTSSWPSQVLPPTLVAMHVCACLRTHPCACLLFSDLSRAWRLLDSAEGAFFFCECVGLGRGWVFGCYGQ